MIASTSAIKLLLLATVVFAKDDVYQQDGSSSTLLRGKIKQVPVSSSRTLIDMPNLNLDEMVCTEHIPLDGSVVCTFRTIPPSDMTSGKIHHDCLRSTVMGRSYCISTEVYRANFNDVPNGASVAPGAQGGAPATGNVQGTQTVLTSAPVPVLTSAPVPVPVPIVLTSAPVPAPVPVQTPTPVQNNVNANVNLIVGTGPTPPTSVNTGVILPQFNNNPDCPATIPGENVGCTENRRCKYYERDANNTPIAALNCDCDGNDVFFCRASLDPIFQPISF